MVTLKGDKMVALKWGHNGDMDGGQNGGQNGDIRNGDKMVAIKSFQPQKMAEIWVIFGEIWVIFVNFGSFFLGGGRCVIWGKHYYFGGGWIWVTGP